jgi:hypothetical protein
MAHEFDTSTLTITLELSLSHLPVSFSPSTTSPFLSPVDHSRLSSHPLLLRSFDLLSTVNLAFTFPLSFTSVMGRRRTVEDYQRTADENGWVPGAHEEEDSKQQSKDEPSDRYKGNQPEAMDQWTM